MRSHPFHGARRPVGPFREVLIAVCRVGALVFLLGSGAALAQTASTGALTGVVTDPSGAVVSGATIHVVNVATGDSHNFASKPDGRYLALLLLPGTYQIDVSKGSFKKAVFTGITVTVTETNRLNVKLAIKAKI